MEKPKIIVVDDGVEAVHKLPDKALDELMKRYYERRCAKCGKPFDGRECQSCYCPICQKIWLESQKK